MEYLFSIMIIGDNDGNLTLSEAGKQTGRTPQNIYNRFGIVLRAGFLYKENKRYYLTDSGRKVYTTICREFDVLVKEIVSELVREAVR